MENTAPQQEISQTVAEQPVPTAPTAPTPVAPPQAANKLLPIFVTVVLIAIAGACGYLLGTQRPSQMVEKNEVIVTPSPVVNMEDPMADWKTYTHTAFTFKYPADVKLTPENPDAVSILKDPGQPQLEGFSNGINLQFNLITLKSNQTLEQYVDAQITALKEGPGHDITQPKQKVTVNGYSGFTYTTEFQGTWKNMYLQSPSSKSTVIQIIDGTQDPQNQGYRTTADQILSTFKFLDSIKVY